MAEFRYLIGRNPVESTLDSLQAPPHEIFVSAKKYSSDRKLQKLCSRFEKRGISVTKTDDRTLDKLASGGPHQGIAAKLSEYRLWGEDDLFALCEAKRGSVLLVACDQIQDPQNLASIARSSLAFGVDGIVVTDRNSCRVGPAVGRASAGAIEKVRLFEVRNLADTLGKFRDYDVWTTGLAMDGEVRIDQVNWSGGVCIVVGNEGRGLRKRVAETCDHRASIPMTPGAIDSLNAAVATAVTLYQATHSR